MLKTIKQLLPFVFLIFLVTILNRPWGTIPALGKLLTPFHGYFQQIEGELTGRTSSLNLPQLRAKVDIIYDNLAVPHIFAQNDHDLYMAQGFIVARDRLWQMEFYTQAAAGRLTEIVGEAALPLDRYHRRIGIALTAIVLFCWQGSIYLLATHLGPFMTPDMMTELSIVGGFLIASSGLSILGVKDFKTMNMLPALVIPVLFCAVMNMI